MKKKKALLIGLFLSSILAVGSFSSITFAWLIHNSSIEEIKVDASSLRLSPTSQKIYKYVFPAYKDSKGNNTSIVDYLSPGSVQNVGTTSNMNTLDPAYLTIQNTVNQEGISGLNTNIVLEFTFEITYTTSIDLYVNASRYYASYIPSQKGAQRISDFIHFDLFTEDDFSSYYSSPLELQKFTGDGTNDTFTLPSLPTGISDITINGTEVSSSNYSTNGNNVVFNSAPADGAIIAVNYSTVWHSVKAAADSKATHTTFGLREDSLSIAEIALEEERPDGATTSEFSFYLNIEYDYNLCSSDDIFNFFSPVNLGGSYVLDKDYTLTFGVKQGAK